MAVRRASTRLFFFMLLLPFTAGSGLKLTFDGRGNVCVSGSQGSPISLGSNPVPQCGLVNTTPTEASDSSRSARSGKTFNKQQTPNQGILRTCIVLINKLISNSALILVYIPAVPFFHYARGCIVNWNTCVEARGNHELSNTICVLAQIHLSNSSSLTFSLICFSNRCVLCISELNFELYFYLE